MKARVKETGEIVDVQDCGSVFCDGALYQGYVDINHNKYLPKDLEFDGIDYTPQDYWTRLEHQYAGMAMQSYVSNNVYLREIREMCKEPQEMRDLIADLSVLLATALVEKLKKKEEK